MNREALRNAACQRIGWRSDVDADTIAEQNNRIDDAMKILASDVPGALLPDTENVVLLKDHTSTSMARTIDATGDLWVLNFGGVAVPPMEALVVDGTWDGGIYHLEITDPRGVIHRRVVREVWWSAITNLFLVSIDRPWGNALDTGMTFRMYQPEFFFRDDVMEVLAGGVWDRAHTTLRTLPANFMEYYSEGDIKGRSLGPPAYLQRGRHVQVEAPTKAPVATAADQTTWVGPHPWVTCRFVYTYVKGKRDAEFLSPGGSYDPMLESSPSPISNSVTVDSLGETIVLSGLPNIDFMQNFGITGTLRKGRSGIRKRIYVYIDAIGAGAGFGTDSIEAQGVPIYIGEVDGETTTFSWDGSVIPEYDRRMPESHGYFAHTMGPHQDQRYEVDFRVRRRPRALSTNQDAPRILPSAEEALIVLVEAAFLEMTKRNEEAALKRKVYLTIELPKVQSGIGNSEHMIPGVPWGQPSLRARRSPWWNGRAGPFTV